MRNLWLDDGRPAPDGFIHVKTSDEAIQILDLERIETLSLNLGGEYSNSFG